MLWRWCCRGLIQHLVHHSLSTDLKTPQVIPVLSAQEFSNILKSYNSLELIKTFAIFSDLSSDQLSPQSQLSSPLQPWEARRDIQYQISFRQQRKYQPPLFSRWPILLSESLFATTIGCYSPPTISRGEYILHVTLSPSHLLSLLSRYLTIPNSSHVSKPTPISIPTQIPIPTLPQASPFFTSLLPSHHSSRQYYRFPDGNSSSYFPKEREFTYPASLSDILKPKIQNHQKTNKKQFKTPRKSI